LNKALRYFLNSSKLVSVLVCCALALLGCGSRTNKQAPATEAGKKIPSRESQAANEKPQFRPLNWRAYEFYVRGVKLEESGDLPGAARSYKQALTYFPESQEIGLSYAHALIRLKSPDQALVILKGLNPTNEVYENRAMALRMKGDEEAAHDSYLKLIKGDIDNFSAYSFLASYFQRERNIDSTVWAYKQIIRIRPLNYQLRNEIARLYLLQENVDGAKEMLWESLKVEPKTTNLVAARTLAEIYQQEKKFDSTAIALELALEMEPTNVLVLSQLVQNFIDRDSIQQALMQQSRIIALDPQDKLASRRLGILYLAADSLDQADSIFTELISAGDSAIANHYYLGRVSILQDEFERARDEFEIVAQSIDTIAQSWLDLGFAFRRLADTVGEINTYKRGLKYIREKEERIILTYALGAVYERTGQYDKSIEAFETILADRPDHAQALNYLGYMLAEQGLRLEYARQLISRALDIFPDNAAFLDSYGWVFYRLGQYDKAVDYLQQAANAQSDPIIFDHLGDALEEQGETDKARIWWQKALELTPDDEQIQEKLGL